MLRKVRLPRVYQFFHARTQMSQVVLYEIQRKSNLDNGPTLTTFPYLSSPLFSFHLSSLLGVPCHHSSFPGGVFFQLSFPLALGSVRWRHPIDGPQHHSIGRPRSLFAFPATSVCRHHCQSNFVYLLLINFFIEFKHENFLCVFSSK